MSTISLQAPLAQTQSCSSVLVVALSVEKVIKDFSTINLDAYLKKNRLNDEEKLLKYFEEVKNV